MPHISQEDFSVPQGEILSPLDPDVIGDYVFNGSLPDPDIELNPGGHAYAENVIAALHALEERGAGIIAMRESPYTGRKAEGFFRHKDLDPGDINEVMIILSRRSPLAFDRRFAQQMGEGAPTLRDSTVNTYVGSALRDFSQVGIKLDRIKREHKGHEDQAEL